ncbi:MAG: ABC transporter permease subunit [Solirubrobacteraceae bacterium]
MSTIAAPPATATAVAKPGVTFPRVLRSEWTKLWTLRSTRWTLLLSFIGMAALGPLVAAVQMSRWGQLSLHDRATFDAIDSGVGGYHLAQLGIGVLGVLVISGEYSTGMIRSSLMAVPRRLPVLGAKIAVYAAVTFVLMLIAALISFFVVQAIVTQHHVQHSIGDPGALRTVVGSALFLTVLGAMCVGLGGLVRNSAGGIAAFVGLLFVLPGISAILPSSVNDSVSPYLPLSAGTTITSHHFDNSHHLTNWGGFALFCGYTLVLIVGASITLLRRDA